MSKNKQLCFNTEKHKKKQKFRKSMTFYGFGQKRSIFMTFYGHKTLIIISYHFYGFLWLRTNPAKTSKHTDDERRQELHRKHHLSASELKEMHQDLHQMYQATPEKWSCCHQNSPDSTEVEEVSLICFEISSLECWCYEKCRVVWWIHLSVHLQQRI